MTKPWDLHEATIKKLYAENTLAVVRKTMIDKYNFKASTRAYRGRLIKWGVRKYNCRRRSDGGLISVGSPDDSMSGSDTASPTSSQPTAETEHDFVRYSKRGRMKNSEPRVSSPLGRSYDLVDMGTPGNYTDSCDRNRALVSPTQEIHGWHCPPTQPESPPTSFAHTNTGITGQVYAYQPLSPASLSPVSNTYSSLAYESEQSHCDRRQSFPLMNTRQYSTSQNGSGYYYGHGHRPAGMGSFDGMCGQAPRHGSTG
ncbi:hypothetical protein ANO14919_034370 [Xylariales sp. No.14919]|nr:hypothetical protein ANO14919_034370 [Xylariales sp. No.14919]